MLQDTNVNDVYTPILAAFHYFRMSIGYTTLKKALQRHLE